MPARRADRATASGGDLQTSNDTSNVFLGVVQRSWMQPGLADGGCVDSRRSEEHLRVGSDDRQQAPEPDGPKSTPVVSELIILPPPGEVSECMKHKSMSQHNLDVEFTQASANNTDDARQDQSRRTINLGRGVGGLHIEDIVTTTSKTRTHANEQSGRSRQDTSAILPVNTEQDTRPAQAELSSIAQGIPTTMQSAIIGDSETRYTTQTQPDIQNIGILNGTLNTVPSATPVMSNKRPGVEQEDSTAPPKQPRLLIEPVRSSSANTQSPVQLPQGNIDLPMQPSHIAQMNNTTQQETRADQTRNQAYVTPMCSPVPQAGTAHVPPHLYQSQGAMPYLPILVESVTQLRKRYTFTTAANTRVQFVTLACHISDLFYLLFHQVYCIQLLEPKWLRDHLGFDLKHEEGLRTVSSLWLVSAALPVDLVAFFSNFITKRSILRRDPAMVPWLLGLKYFLQHFPGQWQRMREGCLKRGFPPCVYELKTYLSGPESPVLQRLCFESIRQTMFPHAPLAFHQALQHLYEQDRQLLQGQQLDPANITEATPITKHSIGVFRENCESLKKQYNVRPVTVLNTDIIPNSDAHGTLEQHTPMVPSNNRNTASSDLYSTFNSHPQINQIAAQSQRLPSDVFEPQQPQARQGWPVHAQTLEIRTGQQTHHSASVATPLMTAQRMQASHLHPSQSLASTSWNSGDAAIQTASASLLPPAGQRLPVLVDPDPNTGALHQALLQSPRNVLRCGTTNLTSEYRMYAYLESFLLEPQGVDATCPYSAWSFDVPPIMLEQRALRMPSLEEEDDYDQRTRMLENGSLLFQLRCIALSPDSSNSCESVWPTAPTHWPECGFFSLNDEFIEVRRKIHHRRDLAADVTSLILTGQNKLQFSHHLDPHETARRFGIAIEVIKTVDHRSALNLPTELEAGSALQTMTKFLQTRADNDDDDDLMITHAHISVDVIDPFTSQIFKKPVRGKTCQHRECFDLESFLRSRISRNKDGLIAADEWLCPICRRNATPKNLIMDGFLLQVRNDIIAAGKDDARAILVKQDGSWEIKCDPVTDTAKVMDVDEPRTPVSATTVVQNLKTEVTSALGDIDPSTATSATVVEVDSD